MSGLFAWKQELLVSRRERARCHSPRSRRMKVRFPRCSSDSGRITGCRTPRRTSAPCCFPCHISSNASPAPKRERIGPVVSLTGRDRRARPDSSISAFHHSASCRAICSAGIRETGSQRRKCEALFQSAKPRALQKQLTTRIVQGAKAAPPALGIQGRVLRH